MAMDAAGERLEMRDDLVRGDVDLPAAQLLSADTMDEPPNIVSAIPPRAFSSW